LAFWRPACRDGIARSRTTAAALAHSSTAGREQPERGGRGRKQVAAAAGPTEKATCQEKAEAAMYLPIRRWSARSVYERRLHGAVKALAEAERNPNIAANASVAGTADSELPMTGTIVHDTAQTTPTRPARASSSAFEQLHTGSWEDDDQQGVGEEDPSDARSVTAAWFFA
jgi:hypothetical protein